MDRTDAFVAGFAVAAIGFAVLFQVSTPSAERAVNREAYGWKRYTEGVTEGSRQATLKCPYNYRKIP